MKPIYFFLVDFRSVIGNTFFKSEENTHPVTFFESEEEVYFYKPVGSVLYWTRINLKEIPEGVNISQIKNEFKAIEIPENLVAPKIISINNVPVGTIS